MANRTKLTPEKKEKFLEYFGETGIVTEAAKKVNLTRPVLYAERKKDKGFASQSEAAYQLGIDALEDEARRRAMDKDKPSDTLMIFLLKGARPEKFVDRLRQEVTPVEAMTLGDTQLAASLLKLLASVPVSPVPTAAQDNPPHPPRQDEAHPDC